MHRIALWLAALGGSSAIVYGFWSTNLFASDTWSPVGLTRFLTFTRIFAIVYLVLAIALRRWIALAILLPVMAFTIRGTGAVSFLSLVLFSVSCALLGRWLFKTADWILAFLGGLCVWAFGMAVFAEVKLHYATVYLAIHTAILLLRRKDLLQMARDIQDALRPRPSLSRGTLLGLGAFLYAFLAQWILVWKPETGSDALATHLAIALDFANNHVFTFDYHQYIWALVPMGADYCYAAVAVLGGEYATRLLNLAMLGIIALLIVRSAKRWIPTGAALLLSALFVSAPIAQLVTGNLFVENLTAGLAIGALCACWEFYEHRSNRMLCLCALLLGSGIGWKLGGLAVAMGVLPFLIAAVRAQRVRFATGAWAAVLFAVPALLPYVKAYLLTGNPVFPFGNPLFSSSLIEDYLTDYRYRQPLTWRTLFDVTFYTQRYYEGQHGSFSFQYLFLLPLSVVSLWKLRTLQQRSAIIAGLIAATVIAYTQPNARYFYSALALLTLGGAVALATVRAADPRLFYACIAALTAVGGLNVWFLPASNWHHRDFFLSPLFAERGKVEYLRSISPARELVPYLNRTTGAILFTQSSEVAGVRPPTFSNLWHNMPMRKQIEKARTAEQFYRTVQEKEIRHFIRAKTVTPHERQEALALFELLDLCGEPEFETPSQAVLRLASDCEARLVRTAPKFATHVLSPGEYNDDDRRIDYIGTWDQGRDRFPQASGNTISFTKERGAEIRFEFEGSAFIYGYTRAFNRGRAEIRIDGVLVEVLDQYSPKIRWQSRKRYALPANGRHFVSIQVTGEKASRSTEAYVDFDFLQIEP